MKFLITSSLIIGTVLLLGASTASNAINTQPLIKSSDSNIVKARGHIGGSGGSHHIGGHPVGGYHGTHGYYNHHHGNNYYGYHNNHNNFYGGGFYDDPSFYYGGSDDYLGDSDSYTGAAPGVCIGPLCLGL
ncbi:MAG: hypothetical protein JNJ47_01845 [Alphaproteobacteria bacterium]|nr:hypothetical protein [Alphaproteobacteria bacterium]